MFHDLQMMVYEDGGELIPMFNNFLDAASSTVRAFVPISTFSLGAASSGARMARRVAMAFATRENCEYMTLRLS
jgi:hypothetical protein